MDMCVYGIMETRDNFTIENSQLTQNQRALNGYLFRKETVAGLLLSDFQMELSGLLA